MFYPVKVYRKHPKEGGKVRRIISSKTLKKRSDSIIILEATQELCGKPVKMTYCDACGKRFPTQSDVTKYCSPGCSDAMKKKQDRESGKRRRVKLKQRKNEKICN